jgi:hypothetical protein
MSSQTALHRKVSQTGLRADFLAFEGSSWMCIRSDSQLLGRAASQQWVSGDPAIRCGIPRWIVESNGIALGSLRFLGLQALSGDRRFARSKRPPESFGPCRCASVSISQQCRLSALVSRVPE